MMAGKSGRLTFSGRQEYYVVPVYGLTGHTRGITAGVTGYVAKCHCALGNHYLIQYPNGLVSECTSDRGVVPDECIFIERADAQAAIEAWQAQREKEAE